MVRFWTHVDVAFFAKNVAHDADAARVGGLVAGGEGEARGLGAVVLSVAQFALLAQSGGHLQQGRAVVAAVEVAQLQTARQVVRFARVLGALLRVLQPSEKLRQTNVHLAKNIRVLIHKLNIDWQIFKQIITGFILLYRCY